jgi:hypothetical protein
VEVPRWNGARAVALARMDAGPRTVLPTTGIFAADSKPIVVQEQIRSSVKGHAIQGQTVTLIEQSQYKRPTRDPPQSRPVAEESTKQAESSSAGASTGT